MADCSPHIYTAYTIVFKGDPLDLQQYRHTALLFVPLTGDGEADAAADTYYCNAVGVSGEFEFEDGTNHQPQLEEKFVAQLEVGRTKTAMTPHQLASLMRRVPVLNDDYEFNCQSWVQLALERLSKDGYLTQEEYDDGVNDMVSETMKAADEPQPFSTI